MEVHRYLENGIVKDDIALLAGLDGIVRKKDAGREVMASLTTSMGRMAAHTGRLITMEEMLEHDHEFAPDLAKLDYDAPAPLQKLPNGKYPIPMPGITKKREY